MALLARITPRYPQPFIWLIVAMISATQLPLAMGQTADRLPANIYVGQSIAEVLDEVRRQGMPVVYSTSLVTPTLQVQELPAATEAFEGLQQLLEPFALSLFPVDDVFVVGRVAEKRRSQSPILVRIIARDAINGRLIDDIDVNGFPSNVTVNVQDRSYRVLPGKYTLAIDSAGYVGATRDVQFSAGRSASITLALQPETARLEEIIVSASHVDVTRESPNQISLIDQQDVSKFPDIGDDPMRALQRLPGIASTGASAQSYIRGGSQFENGIVLDGYRLLDPFHVRDYQSLFSAIDTRVVKNMEVYTGGFPVRYGEQTGGLIVVNSLIPEDELTTELGLSAFSTSTVSAGHFNGTDSTWVVSARRGNLDLVLKPELGEPSYYDVFGKIDLQLTANSRLSANVLFSEDETLIVPAADPEEREEARNDTINLQLWVNWQQKWREELVSQTLFASSHVDGVRRASINDVENFVGNIDDQRDTRIWRISQDWTLQSGERLALEWGAAFERQRAILDYASNVSVAGVFQELPVETQASSRASKQALRSDVMGAYVSARWQWTDALLSDVGFRWDKQTHIGARNDSQLSPRVSVLYTPSESSQLRVHWGRYFQSQRLNELQVEDGVSQFFLPQRSDQFVVALTHRFSERFSLRVEGYRKKDTNVRPRFENLFDPFSIVPELEPDRVALRPSSAIARGIETSFRWDFGDASTFWGGYTWAQARETIDGRSQPRSWDQRHALNLGYSWTGARWAFNVAAKAHSGWPRTDVFVVSAPTEEDRIAFGARNGDRFGDFLSLDMRVDYTHELARGQLNWFFEVSNLTNRRNPCCVDFDTERDDTGRLDLDEQNDFWFPLLPAIGVLWSF